jgi:hypothetical protein
MGKLEQIRMHSAPVSYATTSGGYWSVAFTDGTKISGDMRNAKAEALCNTLQKAIWTISKESGQQRVGDLCAGYQKDKTVVELLSL